MTDYESNLKHLKQRPKGLIADKAEVLQQISLLSARLEAINTSLGMGAAALENQKKLLAESERAKDELETACKTAEKTLFELYGNYKPAASTEEIARGLDTLAKRRSN